MKTRSAPVEPPNIAAIVKARHHARVLCPAAGDQAYFQNYLTAEDSNYLFSVTNGNFTGQSASAGGDDTKVITDEKQKTRPDGAARLLRTTWAPDDRRLFFQGVRMYGRNFTEIARFMRSRGHRTTSESLSASSAVDSVSSIAIGGSAAPVSSQSSNTPGIGSAPLTGTTSIPGSTNAPSNTSGNASCSCSNDPGATSLVRTREQVRVFYQQTWYKIRRYIKFPDDVPQRVREVYALINYSVIRTRIKKPLDHRLGEKLNELVHCGTTIIKHNGRRFLLRTPICPALKLLNHITAPSHEFLLPEDVWIELVPSSQADLWRVLEAEQNPRLRLRVDINRQLSDIIKLVELKWQLAAERMLALLDFPVVRESPTVRLLIRTAPHQAIDGAIRLQEVARVRSGDLSLRSFVKRRLASKTNDLSSDPQGQSEHSPRSNDCTIASNEPMETVDDCLAVGTSVSGATSTTAMGAGVGTPNPSCSTVSSTPATSSTSSIAELDLREMGRQLLQGVTYEAARGIKVLTLFLALGCPDRIQFEYSFLFNRSSLPDGESMPPLGTSSQLLYYQPVGTERCGISNGLRRLLHLNASDYLLHRDWLATQNALSGPPILPRPPPSPATCAAVSSVPVVVSPASTVTPIDTFARPSLVVQPTPSTQPSSMATASQPVLVSSVPLIATASPTTKATLVTLPTMSPFPSVTVCCTPTVSSTPSLRPIAPAALITAPTSTSVLNVIPSSVTPAVAPSLILFPTNVNSKAGKQGQVTVVERQLDHQRKPIMSETIRLSLPSPPSVPKVPISKYNPASSRVESTSVISSNRTPVSIMPRPAVPTRSNTTASIGSSAATSTMGVSSLNSLKAYNIRRRTTVSYRGTRHLLKPNPIVIHPPLTKTAISATSSSQITTVPLTSASASAHPWVMTSSAPASSSLLPSTLSVLNANSVLHFDGDISLGTLLGTNQSSASSLSNDTLASLLKTICPTPTTTTDSSVFTDSLPESTRYAPGLQPMSHLTNPHNTDTNGADLIAPSTHRAQMTSFKCEELSKQSESTDWSDFHTNHDPSRVASTPHPPSESPAFGDISLTDSMAAAVMDIHRDEPDSQDLSLLSPEPTFTSEWSRDAGFSQSSTDASITIKAPSSVMTSPSAPRMCSSVGYVTNMEAFLRMIRHPSTPFSGPVSVEPGTVDLNTLLQSVNGPNTDITQDLLDSQSD